MQMQKKPPVIKHCPVHDKVPLKKRRGRQTRKWLWYCPRTDCEHMEYKR